MEARIARLEPPSASPVMANLWPILCPALKCMSSVLSALQRASQRARNAHLLRLSAVTQDEKGCVCVVLAGDA